MTKYICTLSILVLAVLSACKQEITNAYEKEYTLELSRDTVVFNVGGGIKSVEIKTNQDWWEYTNNDEEDWYLVKDFHDADGYDMLTIYVDSCTELSNRESSLTINAGNQYTAKLCIIQLGNEPYIHVADDLVTTDRDTAVLDIHYVSNMEFDINDVPSWIKVEKTKINDEEVLRMLVSRNETGAERSAEINLKQKDGDYTKTLTIVQLAELSEYEPSDAQSITGNKQIPVVSANASSIAASSDINNAFDDNFETYFQTDWQETEPIELNFVINSGDDLLSYIIYYPSQAPEANAQSIKLAQVMVRKTGEENFTNVKMATFSKDAPTVITPTSSLTNIEEVKFKVMMTHAETGAIPAASCAEVEFYSTSTLYPNIFTDLTCSEILPTVSMEDILNIDDSFYRNIAKHIYNGTYQSERILELEAIQKDRISSKINNASLFEYATGIYFNTEDEHVVFCGEFTGTAPSLMVLNSSGLVSYSLIEGINKIAVNSGGKVYVNNPKDVKIHIAGGVIKKGIEIGEINTISGIDFEEDEVIDIYSQNAHIITPIGLANENAEKLTQFNQKISPMISAAKAFYGVNEGAYKVDSKLGFYIGEESLDLSTLVNLSTSEMLAICDFEGEYSDMVFSVLEEIGNAYEPFLNKYWGADGASSKLFALAYFYENSNISIVKDKKYYSSAIQDIMVANYDYLAVESEWSKVVPLWQMYHYLKNAEGINDYYAQVCNLLKQRATTSSYTKELLTYTNQVTGINFDDFFYKWNMGGKQSAEPVTGALPYYVEDNLSAFQTMAPLSPGKLFTATGLLFSYQNVVAIEVYNAGFLAHVEVNISGKSHTINKDIYSKNMKVRAVGATGESQEPVYM